MPKTITTTVYTFSELDEKAREKAREWYREGGFDYDWYDSVYEDAKSIAALMGIDINQIYFSGFWSQGDGACFECTFQGKEGGAQAVKEYAPEDKELHEIADAWEALQKANGYALEGTVKHDGDRYYHDQCTAFNVFRRFDDPDKEDYEFSTADSFVRGNPEPGAEAARILRRLMRWLYKCLETEYDYLNSDAQVDESIAANGYTFTKDGLY